MAISQKKGRRIRVKLNKQFYDINAVKEALIDFKGVCIGNVLNDAIEIELLQNGTIPRLPEEFCNYVLGLMKNKTLV